MSPKLAIARCCCLLVPVLAGCSGNPPGLSIGADAKPPIVTGTKKVSTLPETLDKSCRGGRARLYDECSDQLTLLNAGRERAKRENKVLLISYGAEWCIWCHVFEKYVHGQTTRFAYTYGSPEAPETRETSTLYEREGRDVSAEAKALNNYVAENFVLLHIDAQYAPNGAKVLAELDARKFYKSSIPFIFSVGKNGKAAATFDHDDVEVRRDTTDWYRGYDRAKLLAALQRMKSAAL